jgi:transposase
LKKYYADRTWFADGELHINGVEAFWSLAKRRLAKFNGTLRNFELHIKECEWRFRRLR